MKVFNFFLFVLSYDMVFNEANSYDKETIAYETHTKYHSFFNLIKPDLKSNQSMPFKSDPSVEFSDKHSKVKRSLLKRPLRPTANAAASSACRSCYSRRKGCLLVRNTSFLPNSYFWCLKLYFKID